MKSPTDTAVRTLTEGSPTYRDLVEIYRQLRDRKGDTVEEDAAQYALAQIVGELIDYYNAVAEDLEKSLGVSAESELDRVLGEITSPTSTDPVGQAGEIVAQWREIERYDPSQVLESARQSHTTT